MREPLSELVETLLLKTVGGGQAVMPDEFAPQGRANSEVSRYRHGQSVRTSARAGFSKGPIKKSRLSPSDIVAAIPFAGLTADESCYIRCELTGDRSEAMLLAQSITKSMRAWQQQQQRTKPVPIADIEQMAAAVVLTVLPLDILNLSQRKLAALCGQSLSTWQRHWRECLEIHTDKLRYVGVSAGEKISAAILL